MAESRQVESEVFGVEHIADSFFTDGIYDSRYVQFGPVNWIHF